MTRKGHTLRTATTKLAECVSRWGNPAARQPEMSRPDRGKFTHVGNGESQGAHGADEASERSLFKVLEAKNAHRNGADRARRSSGVSRKSRSIVMLLVVAAVAVGIGGYATFAGAVDTSVVFQLDGNSADPNGASAPDDWDTLAGGGGSAKSFSGIVPDGTGSSDTGYGSGLTKDTYDVPNWTWVTGTVTPGKSNIAHTYAAAYPNGLLYFGQDKPASSGVNAVGFWFFQNKVGLDSGVTGGNFVGTHKDGDLLITSDFTNGGNTSIINIFKWQSGALVQQSTSSTPGVECGASSGPLAACMISNQTAFTAQWPPYPPGFAVDQYSFVEGGIDLTKIYGSLDAVPCFTNFLADTRTSASEDADLKDFALGNVDTCGKVELKKTWVGTAGNVDLKIGTTSAAATSGRARRTGRTGRRERRPSSRGRTGSPRPRVRARTCPITTPPTAASIRAARPRACRRTSPTAGRSAFRSTPARTSSARSRTRRSRAR